MYKIQLWCHPEIIWKAEYGNFNSWALEPNTWVLYVGLEVVKLTVYNFNVKKIRRKAPFKSEVCVGKDGLWKLLGGFQETYGKAIHVGVIGEFQFNTILCVNLLYAKSVCYECVGLPWLMWLCRLEHHPVHPRVGGSVPSWDPCGRHPINDSFSIPFSKINNNFFKFKERKKSVRVSC